MSDTLKRRRVWPLLIGAILFGLLLAGAVPVVCGVRASLEAERTLQAQIQVLIALDEFVRSHPGEWPKNWEQLASQSNFNDAGRLKWPENSQEIQRRVEVDFDLTPADVASMDVMNFTAVRPIGPNYGAPEELIRQLLTSATAK